MQLYIRSNKKLSYRRETALQGALVLAKKVEEWDWETIFCGLNEVGTNRKHVYN